MAAHFVAQEDRLDRTRSHVVAHRSRQLVHLSFPVGCQALWATRASKHRPLERCEGGGYAALCEQRCGVQRCRLREVEGRRGQRAAIPRVGGGEAQVRRWRCAVAELCDHQPPTGQEHLHLRRLRALFEPHHGSRAHTQGATRVGWRAVHSESSIVRTSHSYVVLERGGRPRAHARAHEPHPLDLTGPRPPTS
eukprot:COSAG03_NODE_2997_length_2300_cov_3.109041_3_plen_193_part_00